jgi:hypothetical protein
LALVRRVDNRAVPQPDLIVLKRDRDLSGRAYEGWIRRGLFALVCAVPVLALLNVFGQRPSTQSAASTPATLDLYAPTTVRSGLVFEARFHITARQDVKQAILVLDPGWLEGMAANTIEPSPLGQASANGKLSLTLGHIPAGQSYVLYMQFQANPTNVGRRSQDVALYDGQRLLLTIDRTITVFP